MIYFNLSFEILNNVQADIHRTYDRTEEKTNIRSEEDSLLLFIIFG